MPDNYPNLMCFGSDCNKCGCEDTCPNYQSCLTAFKERWFGFFHSDTEAEEE